jgi:hypothetical protein
MKKHAKKFSLIFEIFASVLIISVLVSCNLRNNLFPLGQKEDRGEISEEKIRKFYSTVKKIDSEAEAHYKMALYFQKQKRYNLAIEELKIAVGMDPTFAKAYNALGISYDNKREYDQSIHYYKLALAVEPSLDYVYNNLGYSYLLNNNVEPAIEAFQKAIALNGENQRYHNNLGLAYAMTEQYELAIEQFKVIGNETGAELKLAQLLKQIGGVHLDRYLAKKSKIDTRPESSIAKSLTIPSKPVVMTKKIEAEPLINKSANSVSGAENNEIIPLPEIIQSPVEKEIMEVESVVSSFSRDADPSEKPEPVLGEGEARSEENLIAIADSEQNAARKLTSSNFIVIPASAIKQNQPPRSENEPETRRTDALSIQTGQTDNPNSKEYQPRVAEKAGGEGPLAGTDVLETTGDQPVSAFQISSVEIAPKIAETENINDNSKNTNAKDSNIMAREDTTVHEIKNKISQPKIIELSKELVQQSNYRSHEPTASGINNPRIKIASSSNSANHKANQEKTSLKTFTKRAAETTPTKGSHEARQKTMAVEVEIEVANGNGVNGAARKVADYLTTKGFRVVRVTNANSFDHISSKIFYCNGQIKGFHQLLQELPFVENENNIIELKHLGNKVRVLVGEDIIDSNKKVLLTKSANPKS